MKLSLSPRACTALLAFASALHGETITVDFTTVKHPLNPLTFSMVESGYGAGGTELPNQPAQQTAINNLNVAMMRMNLGYKTPGDPNSGIVCMASGASQTITGDQWINAIKASGAAPEIRVQMKVGQESFWATDAANLVKHFNITTGNPVARWVVGNEPDGNGLTASAYSTGFNSMYDAMKAIDSTIKIGGPAVSFYSTSFIETFLTNTGTRADFLDYHQYGTGQNSTKTDAQLLSETVNYETNCNDLRTRIVTHMGATRAAQVDIEVGEWNVSWATDVREVEAYNSIWSASTLGHIISTGAISRQYADKNGPLGALIETSNPTVNGVTYTGAPNDPMPIYHGIGMYTGESLFSGFGTNIVNTTSTQSLLEVYASSNANNILVVNKSPSTNYATTVNLTGYTSGTAAVWQKNGANKTPQHLSSVAIAGGTFSYTFPAYTVTTFVLPSNTLLYEAETLPVASSSDTVRVVSDSHYSGGEGIILDANAVNDFVTFTVNVPAAGTYATSFGMKKNNARGIFQFSSNGVNHGAAQDEYTSADTFTEVSIGNVVFSSSGNKSFQFLITGKNAASSGYSFSLDYIKMVPQ